jgi:TolA-binding protein
MAKMTGSYRRKADDEDELKTIAGQALSFIQEKPRETAMAVAAVVAVVAVVLLASFLMERSEKSRVAAVNEAIARYTAAADADGNDSNAIRAELETMAEKYGDTDMGGQALYYLGGALAREGKYAEAAKVYLDVHNTFTSNSNLAGAALLGAAYSLAAAGSTEEAVGHFRTLLETDDQAVPRSQIRMEVARILRADGDREGAAAELKMIVSDHPESSQAEDARKMLDVLAGS